tara:strand:- start:87203 stop:89734 length:2532 start_codon:yes stop_codon:yes gene_type:complete
MKFILKALSSYLIRHPAQLGLAILGMAVGISVIVAVDMANDSARRSFDQSLDAVTGDATHQILGGPTGLDEQVYIDLRLNGIRDIAPIVDGFVRVDGETYQLLGIDIFAESGFREYQARGTSVSTDSGSGATGLLTTPGGVLMMGRSAKRLNLEPGDPFTISIVGEDHEGILLDIMGGTDSGGGFDRMIIADISVAQDWLGLSGRLSRIDVRAGTDNQILDEIRRHLPPDARLINAEGRNDALLEMSTGFNTSLMAMSLFALLVGVFLIYNCMSFMILQRRPIIGVLRALGVTRGQLIRALLIEGMIIASVGVLIGIVAGTLLGEQLVSLVTRSMSDHYYAVRNVEADLSGFTAFKGVLAGIVATLVAVSVPALEAVSYPPRLTLARSVVEERAGSLVIWFGVGAVLLALLAWVSLSFSSENLFIGFFALFLVIVSAALLAPIVVKLMTPLLAGLMGKIAGLPGRIAVRGITRSLSRTGVAIAALSIAVAEIVGMGIMIDSFRDNVEDWLTTSLHSDIFISVPVRGGSISTVGIDPQLVEILAAVPGVSEYSAVRRVSIENEHGGMRIQAVSLAPQGGGGFDFLSGGTDIWPSFNDGKGVIVSDPYAYKNGLLVGDMIALPTRDGDHQFNTLGIYRDYNSDQGIVTINRATYIELFKDETISSLGLYLEDGADSDTVLDALNAAAAPHQALIMGSNKTLREFSLRIFDRTFIITGVLYWLAMIVAFVGVLAAALALALERGKEMAVLRALGMTRRQIVKLVIIQCGAMGLLAGLIALPVGMISGWLLINVINRRAFGWQIDMILPADTFVTALLIAVGTALVASLYPAWHSTRSTPAAKLREE